MATDKQLVKQIATAKKNITASEKRIAMYSERAEKAIAALNKKGANISIEDIIVTEEKIGNFTSYSYSLPQSVKDLFDFEMTYRVTNNLERKAESERDLERETARLEHYTKELKQNLLVESELKRNNAPLKNALEKAMSEFRTSWFETMRNWHTNHYNEVAKSLPEAKERKNRIDVLTKYFTLTRGYSKFTHSKIRVILNSIRKEISTILSSDAAGISYEAFMEKKEEELIQTWNNGINLLVEKCSKFNLSIEDIYVVSHFMTSKGFTVMIEDNTMKVTYARAIWAAESSSLVTPHLRYIVTQKTIK